MNDVVIEHRRGDLALSSDRSRIDLASVLAMLNGSHWGAGMTYPVLARAIQNSLCIGVYHGDRQVAFARVVTDLATYGYLTDVIVVPEARGAGVGTWIVETLLAHPDLQGFRRLVLWTRDASALYERLGFTARFKGPDGRTYMEHESRSS